MTWLPAMLTQLLASEVFHVEYRPPEEQRGVYLFSEAGQHLYVGRTGITARSRAQGGAPITSFRHRFDQHTQPGRPPGASSFANRLMLERAAELDVVVPGDWWSDRRTTASEIYDLYRAAKMRIGAMECRVVPFEDDVRGVRSTIAEVYSHVHLRTRTTTFRPRERSLPRAGSRKEGPIPREVDRPTSGDPQAARGRERLRATWVVREEDTFPAKSPGAAPGRRGGRL